MSGDAVMLAHIKGASNDQGGADDDPLATRTPEDTVANGYWVNINDPDGTGLPVLEPILSEEPFPRMGGSVSITTNAVPNLIRELQAAYTAQNGGTLHVAAISEGFGGMGLKADGTGDFGPLHPDGVGPAFVNGSGSTGAKVGGAIYLYVTNPQTVTQVADLIAAEFPGMTRLPDIAFGKIGNENDTGLEYHDLVDLSARYIEDFRAAWGQPDMPFIFNSAPPPWSFSGSVVSPKIAAAISSLSQGLPNAAYVEGPGDPVDQHSTEDIHFGNIGLRKIGTRAHEVVGVAKSRDQAPKSWIDFIGNLTNKPARCYSMYRLNPDYTGPAMTVSNTTQSADISFLTSGVRNGEPDAAAMMSAADNDGAWLTSLPCQMGSGIPMSPEGTGFARVVAAASTPEGVVKGIVFQGRRFCWGNDENNIMLVASGVSGTAAGALLAVGRVSDGGTAVQADLDNRTFTILSRSGETDFYIGENGQRLITAQEYEPDFITALPGAAGGYTIHANYVDANGMRANGVSVPSATTTRTGTGAAGTLCWGGRSGQTNRYSNGNHTAVMYWDVAPTGTDLEIIDAWCRSIGAVDDRSAAA
ncbi:hypothetical protein [Tateyamaria sp. 1078]|uniref:hypothetical protein n=1 Tax=Tateyamaria sp. 1078 TaxID=3417464 RepID=UPI003EC0AC89